MIMHRFPNLQALKHSVIVASVLSLAACGGSSESSTPSLDADPVEQQDDDGLLADFVIQEVAMSPTYDREEYFPVHLRVANIGETANTVPRAWMMISETEDFSTGYAIYPFGLDAVEGQSLLIEPGEERDFRAAFQMPLSRNDTYYARVWLNPDLSAYFMNPEDTVVPSYLTREADVKNNLSEVKSFEASDFAIVCLPDVLEENDTIATAAPILLDTEYLINDCYEQLDVFSVDLQEGSVYELKLVNPDPLFATSVTEWTRSIVDADGRYLERPSADNPLTFRPTTTGAHYLVMRHIVYSSGDDEVIFIINSLSE